MGNERIRQIVTLLYAYKTLVVSEGMQMRAADGLHILLDRMYKYETYYSTNQLISYSFDFLRRVIDNWFGMK